MVVVLVEAAAEEGVRVVASVAPVEWAGGGGSSMIGRGRPWCNPSLSALALPVLDIKATKSSR